MNVHQLQGGPLYTIARLWFQVYIFYFHPKIGEDESMGFLGVQKVARWWQLKLFFEIFTLKIGEDEPILTSIFFQMGWFNHQPEKRGNLRIIHFSYVAYMLRRKMFGIFFPDPSRFPQHTRNRYCNNT